MSAAIAVASSDGLSQLTYGRVARHLSIADRTVVYYFSSKDELIADVVLSMGLDLQATLAQTLTDPVADHLELARAAWPVLTSQRAERIFAMFFEANGLAAAGREPYKTIVPQLVDGWIEWAAGFVEGSRAHRRTEAATSIALIDGLLLLRLLAGPKAGRQAARRLGVI